MSENDEPTTGPGRPLKRLTPEERKLVARQVGQFAKEGRLRPKELDPDPDVISLEERRRRRDERNG